MHELIADITFSILFAWVLTGIYVWWANGRYDAAVASLKSQLED